MDRLAMLQQMAAQKPDDPFPRYGLAMELKKQGRNDDAWEAFASLMRDKPDYVPSYLMAGGLLTEMGRREEAAGVLDRGIEAARTAGDAHALSELEAARAELS
jgi:cytochrome c-type biogenesis protein CcmH/NrfG